MIDERLVDGREDAEVERRAFLLELAQRRTRLEVGHAREPGVGDEGGGERQHAAHVTERQRAPPHVVARQPVALDHRGCRADDRLVTQPAPLRVGACAGGVHQDPVVADCDRGGGIGDRLLGHSGAAAGERGRVEEAGRCCLPEQDAGAQGRRRGQRQRARIVGVGKTRERGLEQRREVDPVHDQVVREDHAQAGIGGDVGELLSAIARVDQDRHGAQEGGAEEGLDERGAVRHQDSDPIATPHTERMEPLRHAGGRREELAGRRARVGERKDDVLRGVRCREHEKVAEWDDRRRRSPGHDRLPFQRGSF